MEENVKLNAHNKEEYPPMHSCEHILNAVMGKLFGCSRSRNTHIERKKSRCDYLLSHCPSEEDISDIEREVNEVIAQNLPVTVEYVSSEEAAAMVDTGKLPRDVSETIRIVRIGYYDICACIGTHVANTSEIGRFLITSYDYKEGVLRIRFKLMPKD